MCEKNSLEGQQTEVVVSRLVRNGGLARLRVAARGCDTTAEFGCAEGLPGAGVGVVCAGCLLAERTRGARVRRANESSNRRPRASPSPFDIFAIDTASPNHSPRIPTARLDPVFARPIRHAHCLSLLPDLSPQSSCLRWPGRGLWLSMPAGHWVHRGEGYTALHSIHRITIPPHTKLL